MSGDITISDLVLFTHNHLIRCSYDIVHHFTRFKATYLSIACEQMKGFGGMVSFIAKGGADAANKIASATRLFTLGESLGGVESLIEVPAAMTHLSVQGSPLQVDPALIRLSVGIENADDLIADLAQALA